ncbi:HsdM family class I SAM-dependent methyltransferase, partial [Actinomyces vulturis]|uniref:HsdM family class I SAM-dependent methyltransferase n=1 Tax=Actinomyces vulturis TaxID=1857645 RepID=UPI0008325C00
RDLARDTLGLTNSDKAQSGVGQITTFNQLGFKGISDKPDGWYLPHNTAETAVVLETKASRIALGQAQVDEILKNVRIIESKYSKVVGVLYNGDDTRVFMGEEEYKAPGSNTLHNIEFYTELFNVEAIDKERIYELTSKINNCLHFEFGVKNLYHRMIFTACALVAQRYGVELQRLKDLGYATFHTAIHSTLAKSLEKSRSQNNKIDILLEEYSDIKMNTTDNQEAINSFIDWVVEISECVNSSSWRGEDVMGIFFNEFNRYKKKSESGQIFTPEHITDFMYRIVEVNKDDRVLDATCGSGGFLVKSMSNMIQEAGGVNTAKAKQIKQHQLYGIEFDREIYALACANMLIHKDGKTNLEQLDARKDKAARWIEDKDITKVLMNPPYEKKYGCMTIVENVLDNVPPRTPCAFILPDKKLEKTSKKQMKRILSHHRLKKIIKLPEDLFFGVGVTTSVFIFESGVAQDNKQIFACYMETDGLVTVKNKGRHDVYEKWAAIEDYWVDVVEKQSGDDTCQWIKPDEHLSYQLPQKPFEIFEEDFKRTAMDYLLFQRGIDAKEFGDQIREVVMYSSSINTDDENVIVSMDIDGNSNE